MPAARVPAPRDQVSFANRRLSDVASSSGKFLPQSLGAQSYFVASAGKLGLFACMPCFSLS